MRDALLITDRLQLLEEVVGCLESLERHPVRVAAIGFPPSSGRLQESLPHLVQAAGFHARSLVARAAGRHFPEDFSGCVQHSAARRAQRSTAC